MGTIHWGEWLQYAVVGLIVLSCVWMALGFVAPKLRTQALSRLADSLDAPAHSSLARRIGRALRPARAPSSCGDDDGCGGCGSCGSSSKQAPKAHTASNEHAVKFHRK